MQDLHRQLPFSQSHLSGESVGPQSPQEFFDRRAIRENEAAEPTNDLPVVLLQPTINCLHWLAITPIPHSLCITACQR